MLKRKKLIQYDTQVIRNRKRNFMTEILIPTKRSTKKRSGKQQKILIEKKIPYFVSSQLSSGEDNLPETSKLQKDITKKVILKSRRKLRKFIRTLQLQQKVAE